MDKNDFLMCLSKDIKTNESEKIIKKILDIAIGYRTNGMNNLAYYYLTMIMKIVKMELTDLEISYFLSDQCKSLILLLFQEFNIILYYLR